MSNYEAIGSAACEVAEGASVVLPDEAGPQFVQFTEMDDREGEVWYWLQFDGNEPQLARLRRLLDEAAREADSGLAYTLTVNYEPEAAVDLLVKYSRAGYYYYPQHTKVEGVFTCPATVGDYGDGLYKGRIVDHFKPAGDAA